jgi:hypothetical protein
MQLQKPSLSKSSSLKISGRCGHALFQQPVLEVLGHWRHAGVMFLTAAASGRPAAQTP